MAKNFNLNVDEDDVEELLEVFPETLTNELLEQERVPEEEGGGKETAGGAKGEPSRGSSKKIRSEGFTRSFLQTSTSSLKCLKTWTSTQKGFH